MLNLKHEWAQYQATGDPEARCRLILRCMPLVRYVVGKVSPGLPASVERDDLIGSAIVGLVSAIDRYDPSRQAKFESYAILRIRGAVLDELRANDFNPRTVRRRIRRADQIRKRLIERYRGTPAEPHLAEALNAASDDFADDGALRIVSFVSIHDPDPNGSGRRQRRTLEALADTQAPGVPEQIELAEASEALADAIEALPAYERLVIRMHYHKGMMLKEIGRLFRVTESRISQVHGRALRRLRAKLRIFL
jgi:RNA polymerase sigma factor for flagellar operon FliA